MRLLCKIFGHKWEDVTATKAGFYDDIAHECLRCGSMQYSSRAKRELMKHITKYQSEESTRTTDEQIEEAMAKFHLKKDVKYDVKASDSVIVITHTNNLQDSSND